MKVLFLDFDGVLNSWDWMNRGVKYYKPDTNFNTPVPRPSYQVLPVFEETAIDPRAVRRLNRVTEATGAKIVVSSAWRAERTPEQLQQILTYFGATGQVISITPWAGSRGNDIDAWLKEHPEVTQFAIVDDDADVSPHKHRAVKTEMARGLLDEHCEKLIKLLT